MQIRYKLFLIVSLLVAVQFLVPTRTYATHIRAGEITARWLGGLTYEFTFVGYRDLSPGEVIFGMGLVDHGDGEEARTLDELDLDGPTITALPDGDTERWEFRWEKTFPSGGIFTIGYREFNRNGGILNMNNSVNTPFYIETQLVIDPGNIGRNNTPDLLIPPIDQGCINTLFIHNPGADDPEGDSISYKIRVPKQDVGFEVDGYRFPADPDLYGGVDWDTEDGDVPALFTLDSITGDVVWNAPGIPGEYNIAFIIEEWRKINGEFVRISFVTRDMQVIIQDGCNNDRPELEIPADTCVEAGTTLTAQVIGTDPNGDPVLLEAFGGPFEQNSSPATFTTPQPGFIPPPAIGTFNWNTNCTHIQERPYEVRFKISDDSPSGPPLVDFKTWRITVVAPAPVADTAQVISGRRIQVQWDDYTCKLSGTSEVELQIWRRVGSYEFEPANCEIGIPENAGYELIGTVGQDVVSFVDDNNGEGLAVGANYCYRIVAIFPLPEGGVSYASNEVCNVVLAESPVITNVSIESTSPDAGEIFVRWTSPLQIDPVNFPPPFTYEVYRALGFDGNADRTLVATTMDTTIVDTGLNTLNQVYNYRILLFDSNGDFVDSSSVASSVRLDLISGFESIGLNWQASVPWSNTVQNFPYHYVYRDQVLQNDLDALVLIDSVDVTVEGFQYLDDGSFNGTTLDDETEYCYFVSTQGSYGNDVIPEPLINLSQIICGQPNDTVPPCEPINFALVELDGGGDCAAFLADKPCDFDDFVNELVWTPNDSSECDNDVRSYDIFYSRTGEEEDFVLLDNTTSTFYDHTKDSPIPLTSFAGCYRVRAVDRSGNISDFSETICRDNCPYYELPNVFTPNGDGFNDTFREFTFSEPDPETGFSRCPRFVQAIQLTVYNRYGKEVYTFNSESPENPENPALNWDGKNDQGTQLSTGVYYYVAEVRFEVLNPDQAVQQINGWVHILE